MKMQKLLWQVLGVALMAVGCQRNVVTTSLSPAATAYKIDGKLNEWGDGFLAAASFPDVQYQIACNEQYLYVCARTLNQRAQSLIIQQGLGLWLDTLGKQHTRMGVRFPLPMTDAHYKRLAERAEGNERGALEKAYIELCNEFEIVGFAPEPMRVSNISSTNFKAALSFDELGEMTCEYQIPWKSIYQTHGIQWTETINIGLKVNDIVAKPNDDNDSYSSPNPMSQMNGGMNGTSSGLGTTNNALMNQNPFSGGTPTMATSQQMRNTPTMPQLWSRFKLTKSAQ